MIISILTDSESGGTFLNWSLHFLSGHSEYYYTNDASWIPLTENPLTEFNSHGFKSNQANLRSDLQDLKNKINQLKAVPTSNFHSIYFHDSEDHDSLNVESVQLINSLNNKIVFVDGSRYPLCYIRYTPRAGAKTIDRFKVITDPDEIFKFTCEKYFKDSYKRWQDLKLTEIWDKREFIALNFRPFEFKKRLETPKKYYNIDIFDLWTSFDLSVIFLFEYLDLKIIPERFNKWTKIYNRWKKIHYNNIRFHLYFDKIIEFILNGNYLDLRQFNLDIQQEGAIQHALLYKHNLNLKTWQLIKFTDTVQLHNLLEPNIYHKLST